MTISNGQSIAQVFDFKKGNCEWCKKAKDCLTVTLSAGLLNRSDVCVACFENSLRVGVANQESDDSHKSSNTETASRMPVQK